VIQKSKDPQLPSNWIWTHLGEISETTSGGTPSRKHKEYFDGTIPWLKSGELDNALISSSEEFITQEALRNSATKIIPHGTLLVALYGATAGKLGILGIEAAINQAICAITTYDGLSNKFLFWYLAFYREKLLGSRIGGAQPNLTQGIVRKIPVPLAPFSEQGRIVCKLEELFTRLDAGVAALQNIKAQLQLYRQAVLKHAFNGKLTEEWRKTHKAIIEPASALLESIQKERQKKEKGQYKNLPALKSSKLPILPDGWVWATWEQISEWVTYGFTRPMPHVDEGIPIVTAKNVKRGNIQFKNTHKTTIEAFEELSEKDRPRKNDVLITKDGTIGRAAIVRTEKPFCINQSVAVVWLRDCPIKREYLLSIIESPFTQKLIWSKARGVALKHLSITDFKKMPLPIPSSQEQQAIINEIERRLSVADNIEQVVKTSLLQARTLRQSILKNAFKGRLVAQDPADEPAERLLERIEKEKQSNQKKGTKKRKTGKRRQRSLNGYVE